MGLIFSKLGWRSATDKNTAAQAEPEKKVYSWDLRPSEDAQNLQFSNKADEVLVKLPGSINGKPFNIVNLNSCRVFLLDNMATINIDNCSNCAIFIGPTNQSVFIRDSTACNFIVSCQQFRMRDCSKVNVLLHCTSQPIIESSSKIKFACFQFYYEALQDQLQSASLSPYLNYWSNIYDFSPNSDSSNPNHGYLSDEKITECLDFFDVSKLDADTLPDGLDPEILKLDLKRSCIPKTKNHALTKSQPALGQNCLLVVLPFGERNEVLLRIMDRIQKTKDENKSNDIELAQSVESTLMTQDELDRLLNIPALALNASKVSGGDAEISTKRTQLNFVNKIKSRGKVIALLFSGQSSEQIVTDLISKEEQLKSYCFMSQGQVADAQFEQLQNYMQMQFH
ncbi:protein XRP2-like [Symsagittifera roscoffensis]|uniref:protein XRP2-like n=1 Tax=Symsagittifera roscoffensis TaxID=84072 RepID=UPI00307C95C7